MSNSPAFALNTITVQLMDSASGRIVQLWQFPPRETISIGRATEQDVSIVDPYVSRLHAELRFRDGQWWLVALGRHGVLVNGRDVTETPLADGTSFRLGGSGPILRFYSSPLADGEERTLSGIKESCELLPQINAAKRDDEVRGIVETDYFQKLRQQARQLRQKRDTDAG
ncbi:MAG: FHA domain-containing protein [Planctomycetes bacterium]|nr:FHA domain-containing protein [Planctomycetota bacterium]